MAVKHKDLKKVVSELENASKMHLAQSKTIKQHIEDMKNPIAFNSAFNKKMMNIKSEFENYAVKHCNVSSLKVHDYQNSMTPYILEERALRATQMDIFSRLMMEMCT